MDNAMQDPWDQPLSHHQHDRDECADLAKRQQQRPANLLKLRPTEAARLRHLVADASPGRQQHEGQHHRKILDYEPADCDPALLRLHDAAFLQRTQQHDSGGDRKGEAEDDPGLERPAHEVAHADAQQGGDGDLGQRAGQGDGADGEKIIQREMQAHAEHQQDHTDLGQFGRKVRVTDKPRREGPDNDARNEITDQRRQPQTRRDHPEHEGKAQADGQKGDQRCPVGHRAGGVLSRMECRSSDRSEHCGAYTATP